MIKKLDFSISRKVYYIETVKLGEIPIACVVVKDEQALQKTINEVVSICQKELKDTTSIPAKFIQTDEIPYIPTNGKIDITKLKDQVKSQITKKGKVLQKTKN